MFGQLTLVRAQDGSVTNFIWLTAPWCAQGVQAAPTLAHTSGQLGAFAVARPLIQTSIFHEGAHVHHGAPNCPHRRLSLCTQLPSQDGMAKSSLARQRTKDFNFVYKVTKRPLTHPDRPFRHVEGERMLKSSAEV
jgi:hypothetical protein